MLKISHRTVGKTVANFALFLIALSTFVFAADPYVSPTLSEKMKTVLHGVHTGVSIVIGESDLKEVEFHGAASGSNAGQGAWMAPGGVWLDLKNAGADGWANSILQMRRPIPINRYNSIVLWVKSNTLGARFWVDMQDDDWKQPDTSQARTDSIVAHTGLPNQCVQVVIPYRAIHYDGPFNFRKLRRIVFDIGQDSAGNQKGADIQILGIAFVRQSEKLQSIEVRAPDADTTHVNSPTLASPPVRARRRHRRVPPQADLNTKDTPTVAPVEVAEERPLLYPSIPTQNTFAVSDTSATSKGLPWRSGLIVIVLTWLVGLLFWRVKNARKPRSKSDLGKFFRQFRELSAVKPNSVGWITYSQGEFDSAKIIADASDAKKNKSALFPSVCFVRSKFNFQSFLNDPRLFVIKEPLGIEANLSDEELRTKYSGYFPVWIPPIRQRQYELPQRIMVAYGRWAGAPTTTDSAQYDLCSPRLKALAVESMDSIAREVPGVRIEGAAALLNQARDRQRLAQGNSEGCPDETEFWTDVITQVKHKHPMLVLVADAAGTDGPKLLQAGFDYFENDFLRQTLLNQIRLKETTRLNDVLVLQAEHLPRSIYDISPLFELKPVTPLTILQSRLSIMLLSLFPGVVSYTDPIPGDLKEFFDWVAQSYVLLNGRFRLINSGSAQVLAFARWVGRSMFIVAANFSGEAVTASLRINDFVGPFDPNRLYLFNEALHGKKFLSDLPVDTANGPAVAAHGQDLRTDGLQLKLAGLSLKVLSISFSRTILSESSREIPQLHKA